MQYYMKSQETLFRKWIIKYKPYWPIFLFLSIIFFGMAYLYIYYANPKFQATASLIIKDEKKGNDDSRIMESLNLIGSKKIIENEIEVLKSTPVLEAVVKKLHLYSNVYLKKGLKKSHLYKKTPLVIEAFEVSKINPTGGQIEFFIDWNKNVLRFFNDTTSYTLNSWVNTPFGVLRFVTQSGQKALDHGETYLFEIVSLGSKTEEILANLKVASSNKLSSIVELKYKDGDPELAEKVLNEIIASYNIAAVAEKNVLAKNTLQFIEERMNIVGGQLNDIERKIQQYKSNVGAVDISTQGKLYLENVSNNDQKLSEINLQLSVINSLEKNLSDNSRGAGSHSVVLSNTDPIFSQLLSTLNNAELEKEKLRKTVAENNPILIAVNDQIIKTKESIYKNIVDQRRNLETAKQNILETNLSYTSLLQAIPSKERELLEISRDQQIKSGIYSFLLQKREESELSYVSNLSDSRVVNHAQASKKPISPNKLMVFGFAFFALLVIPTGSIAIRETLGMTILYRQEIEEMSKLPIIGELAFHKKLSPLAIQPGKRSLVAEEFRRIRYALQYYFPQMGNKRVLITSSLSGEGKSFFTSNLAISFAGTGKKVALLDFDLHNSSLEKIFVQENKIGITDYLSSDLNAADIIQKVQGYDHLYFVPNGTPQNDPSQLIESAKVQFLFDYLDKHFDIILIDTPPVALVSDAYKLSQYCMATIYVIRHGYTPKQIIKRLDESVGINPLINPVLVFNGVKNRGFVQGENGYGYKYTNGYKSYYTA